MEQRRSGATPRTVLCLRAPEHRQRVQLTVDRSGVQANDRRCWSGWYCTVPGANIDDVHKLVHSSKHYGVTKGLRIQS